MADLGISGLASDFDWRSFIEQITEIERAPQRRLLQEQSNIEQRGIAFGGFVTQLNVLKNRTDSLKTASLFDGRVTSLGDATAARASADSTAALGSYRFNFTQLATASSHQGTVNVGQKLSNTSNVDALALGDAAFATAITPGTFTVNSKKITIEDGDTLGEVFTKINVATGNVTATYDESEDKIQLTASGGPVVLGSANDTSNFLQVARLYNNGTGSVASTSALGAIQQSNLLSNANFATPITNGGGAQGSFKINGVSITFNAAADKVSDVLARINSSTAGVTATFDSINDRFLLTNKTTGDLGIAMEDVAGNFLAASGLSSGSLNRGKNLEYTINDGGTLTSLSNTVTSASSGIAGLTVTALSQSATTVDVSANTDAIKTAITGFITEYNKMQATIDAETASTTDADGKVTAGILSSQREAVELASKLRGFVNRVVSDMGGPIRQLASLGIHSNGTNDQITLKDSQALDAALTNNLEAVKDLFTNATSGLAVKLGSYLELTAGEEGSLVKLQENLSHQSDDIDQQIVDLERLVQANEERLINSFVSMETAQAKINQQTQYLSQRFGT